MKKLRCSLGLHKWVKHWGSGLHIRDNFSQYFFGGMAIGVVGYITFLSTVSNLTSNQFVGSAFGCLLLPTIIGMLLGVTGNTFQDKTCIYCHKHDFAYTMWKKKTDAKATLKEKLENAARKDYEETKQFLKV